MNHLRALTAVTLSAALTGLGAVASAPAASADPNWTTRHIIDDVEYSPLTSTSYISGAYLTWDGSRPRSIDWSTDGCSVPLSVKLAIPVAALTYSNLFKPSCVLHDFGYRNYGSHFHYDRTRARKDSVDSRFLANMRIQCGKLHSYDPRKWACGTAANAFYSAVHRYGDKAFFG